MNRFYLLNNVKWSGCAGSAAEGGDESVVGVESDDIALDRGGFCGCGDYCGRRVSALVAETEGCSLDSRQVPQTEVDERPEQCRSSLDKHRRDAALVESGHDAVEGLVGGDNEVVDSRNVGRGA